MAAVAPEKGKGEAREALNRWSVKGLKRFKGDDSSGIMGIWFRVQFPVRVWEA